jgi:large conductance mechanosensitive channel
LLPADLHVRRPAWIEEFTNFIMRGNVVDLAVGIVIGAAFTGVVNSLVRDLFNPLLGLLLGGVDFTNLFVTLRGPYAPTLDAAKAAGAVTLNVGVFVNTVIQFVIVGFAVFWLVKALARLRLAKSLEKPAPPREEVLLEEIRDLLKRREESSQPG